MVPVGLLSTNHRISEPDDRAKLQRRIDELQEHLPEILRAGKIDAGLRQKFIPSASPVLRVAKGPAGQYYVFDGNSRTEALCAVLGKQHPDIKIDVVVYEITDPGVAQALQEAQKQRKGGAD